MRNTNLPTGPRKKKVAHLGGTSSLTDLRTKAIKQGTITKTMTTYHQEAKWCPEQTTRTKKPKQIHDDGILREMCYVINIFVI